MAKQAEKPQPRTGPTHRVARVRAKYDVAQSTPENRAMWAMADGYSPDYANNLAVRIILRNRARYVFANNPRAKGIIRTLAKHTVGTGPRLQMMMGDGKQARNRAALIETEFTAWAKEICLAKKLRVIRIAKVITGEIFPKLVFNPRLNHRVKLDLQLVEGDRVTNPSWNLSRGVTNDVDGVFFDEYGNPDYYRVSRSHPGDSFQFWRGEDYDDVPSKFMLHYFDAERPDQHRGVPEITPAVQLVEEGRRFRAAVLAAAETAADFAMAIQTDSPADVDGAQASTSGVSAMDTLELPRRLATVLPEGYKLAQTKAEQPTTTFKEFSRELLSEVARCLEMPLSIASLDASDANMSSSYVVNQPYVNAIEVERGDISTEVLDPMFDLWLTLAVDPDLGIGMGRRTPDEFPHAWNWPLVMEHADPSKRASATETNLRSNVTTLAREFARQGLDWEEELRQRAKELELMKELGIPDQFAAPAVTDLEEEEGDGEETDSDLERIKAEADAYGVAVRAGTVTPQAADENLFRTRLGLPPMSAEATKAWKADKGVRRPITLTPPAGAPARPGMPGAVPPAKTDDDAAEEETADATE